MENEQKRPGLFAFLTPGPQGDEILSCHQEYVGFTRFIGVDTPQELEQKKRVADETGRNYRIARFVLAD